MSTQSKKTLSHQVMTSPDQFAVPGDDADLKKLLAQRDALAQQQTDDMHHWAVLETMAKLIPVTFHRNRKSEIRDTGTRRLRAVLDYILFLDDTVNSEAAVQQRNKKDPHGKKEVSKALRDAIPNGYYREIGEEKEKVEDDDVQFIILAARKLLLDATKNYSGQDWTGAKAFVGATFIKEELSKHREGSFEDLNIPFNLNHLESTRDNILESNTIIADPPFSARSTTTTATEQLAKYTDRAGLPLSPGGRISPPTRETRSQRRSLSNKRAASEVREQPPKRTKVDGTINEEASPLTREGRGKPHKSPPIPTASTSTSATDVFTAITHGAHQAQAIVDDQASEISQLKETLAERDSEIRELEAAVKKQNDELAKPAKDSLEIAIRKEKQKALVEELAYCKDVIAIVRAVAKAKGATEEELKEQIANITSI